MRNWKMVGIASAVALAVAVAAAYAPMPSAPSARMGLPRTAPITYAATHRDVLHTRVAQSCIAVGQACVINGTPCCGTATCTGGTFPNTTCK